jgi:molecular chaperone GrpE
VSTRAAAEDNVSHSKRDRSRETETEPKSDRGNEPAEPEIEEPAGAAPGRPADAEEPAATTDFRDRWLRAEADLQNFRRRAARDAEEARRVAEEGVFLEIMSALDDLERAIASANEAGAHEAWLQGVTLVAQRLRDYLQRQGVRVVDPLGEPFDPNVHDALVEMDAPEGTKPGTVVQVVHKGYARGDRALRPARVVVARAGGA